MAQLGRVEIAINKATCLVELFSLVVIATIVSFTVFDTRTTDCWSVHFVFKHAIWLLMSGCVAHTFCLRVKQLGSHAPGLALDERGLTDHSGSFSPRFVAWPDIAEIKIVRPPRRGRKLSIRLSKVAARGPVEGSNALQAARQLWNQTFLGTLHIPEHLLKIDLDELLLLTRRYHTSYAATA
jgi:hypothetical protein